MTRREVALALAATMLTPLLPAAAQPPGRPRGGIVHPPGHRPPQRTHVVTLIRRLEMETDGFRARFEELVRRRKVEGRKARSMRDRIRRLESSVDLLRAHVERNSRWFLSKREVNRVMADGKEVQRGLNREPEFKELVERRWDRVRRQLNEVARAFGVRTLGERD